MIRQSGTYVQIQKWLRDRYGFTAPFCWIAHCKELYGLPVAPRTGYGYRPRERQCPVDKQSYIREAFEHFHLLSKK
jgi:hypothetical protein